MKNGARADSCLIKLRCYLLLASDGRGGPQHFVASWVGSCIWIFMRKTVIVSSSFEHVDIIMYKVRKKDVNCNLLITIGI